MRVIVTRSIFVLLLLGSLAACGWGPQTIGPGASEHGKSAPHAEKIVLPPAIKASHVYRCSDGSVAYVDFLTDDRTANLRTAEHGPVIRLEAPAPGLSFAGSGYVLTGSSRSIKLSAPGEGTHSCRA